MRPILDCMQHARVYRPTNQEPHPVRNAHPSTPTAPSVTRHFSEEAIVEETIATLIN
jgi:hypothetical protein